MPFKKGQIGNPKGRPIGSKQGETIKAIRENLADLIAGRMKKLNNRLDECDAKDELAILCKLLEYVIPKIQAEVPADDTVKKVDFYAALVDTMNKRAG